jgi:plastocyanin domain-containing protein
MTKLLSVLIPLTLVAACKKDAPATSSDPTRFAISVTENGFEPESVDVPAGKPVTLVFDRKTDATCAKSIVLTMADGTKLERELPLDTPVELAATFPQPGKLGYACSMDMIKGTIVVR